MRPRALAVALGLPMPRVQSESIASEIAAFLRKQGVDAKKRRGQEEFMVVGGAPPEPVTFTTSAFDASYVSRVVDERIVIEQVTGPKSIETAPELDVWQKNDGGER